MLIFSQNVFTAASDPMPVNIQAVASSLYKDRHLRCMQEFTLERNLICVSAVAR